VKIPIQFTAKGETSEKIGEDFLLCFYMENPRKIFFKKGARFSQLPL
jgi:hypothetical protein